VFALRSRVQGVPRGLPAPSGRVRLAGRSPYRLRGSDHVRAVPLPTRGPVVCCRKVRHGLVSSRVCRLQRQLRRRLRSRPQRTDELRELRREVLRASALRSERMRVELPGVPDGVQRQLRGSRYQRDGLWRVRRRVQERIRLFLHVRGPQMCGSETLCTGLRALSRHVRRGGELRPGLPARMRRCDELRAERLRVRSGMDACAAPGPAAPRRTIGLCARWPRCAALWSDSADLPLVRLGSV
jgi:hypothetical protein